jgi:predicted RNA-binding protein with PUA-like domain
MVACWLMKSEPSAYSWENLLEDGATHWDGVRNYQARNMMRDLMKVDDLVLFYHSNCKPPHVAGIARVCREGYDDHTSWDVDSEHFDEKSTPQSPRWFMVDIEAVSGLKSMVSLTQMKSEPSLEGMPLLARGQRLSVQPVTMKHFEIVCRMGGIEPSIYSA